MTTIDQIPIFVLTLENHTSENQSRCSRLKNRLKHFNLLHNTTFVEGFFHTSPLVQFYCYHMPEQSKIYSCTLGHLACLRKFVESKEEYGMILEDDAMFHINFVHSVNELLLNPPETVLMLCFIHSAQYHHSVNATIGLNKITPDTYGAQGYIINREYAIKCLGMFDMPRINYLEPGKHTSEIINIYSGGNYINPPLIIEEALQSVIGHNTDTHLKWFSEYCKLTDYLIESEEESVVKRIKEYCKK
jgi:hypothetical protein